MTASRSITHSIASHIKNFVHPPFRRKGPFRFGDLPHDIRIMIYPYAFAVDYDGQARAMLLAIAKEKDLYEEAKPIFRRVHVVMKQDNIAVLKDMHVRELLKYRHLMIDCGPFCGIGGHKLTLMNNLRTIAIDHFQHDHMSWIPYFIRASSALTTLRLRFPILTAGEIPTAKYLRRPFVRDWTIKTLNRHLQLQSVTGVKSLARRNAGCGLGMMASC